jgi:hypothetical protein
MSETKEKDAEVTEKMVNIVSQKGKNGNIVISMEDAKYYYLPFDKSIVDLSNPKIRQQFIKAVETIIRSSKLYKRYINYLKSDVGLTHCAVFGNIKSEKGDKTKIEMHHGPIFTLYDYVSIVLEKYLREHRDVNTFDIQAEVLDLHKRKLVQTVMLSESVHKSMDNKKLAPFIPMEMTYGDLLGFVKEYGQYFSPQNRADLRDYFNNYKMKLEEKKLNMFKPIFTKYDIRFTTNKPGEQK